MSEVIEKAKKAKAAKEELVHQPTEKKNEALSFIAEALRFKQDEILAENEKDIARGKEKGVSPALLDRLALTPERLNDMADAVMLLIKLEDPVGETLETIRKDNGLFIENVRVPLGVVGMIYEARPNVTVDAATLCLKTGNAVILRGSSSAINSNQALVRVIREALEQSALPQDAVQLIEDTSREAAKQLFTLNDGLDVLIPRGGKDLIDMVVRESTVPVLETGAGNCHIFIDESARSDMAEQVVINAKTQRPSVCNAIETVLIHKDWAEEHTTALLQKLEEAGVEIRGDEAVCAMLPSAVPARETDWETEFLSPVVSIKTVAGIEEAIRHIRQYGTRHSEAILTENQENARFFLTSVDAAAVYHNASTRFTDGFEFGYGAEIGISTQKLHARGPMGLKALTSSKYIIKGNGQIRI
ncbi:glutamate-5-semialdehyde dehydrogenase [Bacillus sp. GM2]|uniref:glutamate-5-semialdehyde dehydrogenase n=1 Tax=Bacillus TaxID=1386 RepID=UPI000952C0AF|nr:glutamate-5-semialdehyde dehydrogenase [Bacillus paralicheniformis]MSN99659.1 glutamate-5-semialdehyde dehydrogenase [Bacillus paralicheniformis]MSO03667.1 glutamate-5-semialdehyde dehydrogenase [Bacillus paralicheniformis]MSO07660.1 glutamate-5-semialdehyde dehydrogenase [Bacillus paralicheniformis]MSO11654.1 glutamate-5-semialdehyde dehydrogenase [Bacillus paralicheniformis]NJE37052.1 glutamate-5-semialdehyde dehydrogenase [Bacillus paralicheniformis]